MAYWLMKSEPETFGIVHLKARHTALWDGVRNYQARNFLRQMKIADSAFFYHSNCKIPGIVGVMTICREGYADPTQFDPNHHYFDAASTLDNPRWTGVDVEFVEAWSHTISLEVLRQIPALNELALVKRGNRLSLMPLTPAQWQAIMQVHRSMA